MNPWAIHVDDQVLRIPRTQLVRQAHHVRNGSINGNDASRMESPLIPRTRTLIDGSCKSASGPEGDIVRGHLRLTALAAGALAAGTSRQDQPSCRVSGEGKQLGISFLEFLSRVSNAPIRPSGSRAERCVRSLRE